VLANVSSEIHKRDKQGGVQKYDVAFHGADAQYNFQILAGNSSVSHEVSRLWIRCLSTSVAQYANFVPFRWLFYRDFSNSCLSELPEHATTYGRGFRS
jgi:hypothetical protein